MMYVLTNLDEVMPYLKQFLDEFWRGEGDAPTQEELDTILAHGAGNGSPDFISWFKRKVSALSYLFVLSNLFYLADQAMNFLV
jgi:hypothetical protein